ncbi:hypothetical protein D3C87_1907140 [compost metagenome]
MLQLRPALRDLGQHTIELFTVAAAGVVELDQLAAFGQGKANALAAQDQLQADFVPGRVNALQTTAFRAEQALLFIEADGPRGDVQLAGQVGNAVGLGTHGGARVKA